MYSFPKEKLPNNETYCLCSEYLFQLKSALYCKGVSCVFFLNMLYYTNPLFFEIEHLHHICRYSK